MRDVVVGAPASHVEASLPASLLGQRALDAPMEEGGNMEFRMFHSSGRSELQGVAIDNATVQHTDNGQRPLIQSTRMERGEDSVKLPYWQSRPGAAERDLLCFGKKCLGFLGCF